MEIEENARMITCILPTGDARAGLEKLFQKKGVSLITVPCTYKA